MSKITWTCFFCDKIQEKMLVLDRHCGLKSASLRPINERWVENSPWFNNALSSTQYFSNGVCSTKYLLEFLYILLQCLFCRPVVLTIQGFFPTFPCIISSFIVILCYIYFICGIITIIRIVVIMNRCTKKITIWWNSFGRKKLTCCFLFKSKLIQWLVVNSWH